MRHAEYVTHRNLIKIKCCNLIGTACVTEQTRRSTRAGSGYARLVRAGAHSQVLTALLEYFDFIL